MKAVGEDWGKRQIVPTKTAGLEGNARKQNLCIGYNETLVDAIGISKLLVFATCGNACHESLGMSSVYAIAPGLPSFDIGLSTVRCSFILLQIWGVSKHDNTYIDSTFNVYFARVCFSSSPWQRSGLWNAYSLSVCLSVCVLSTEKITPKSVHRQTYFGVIFSVYSTQN